MAPTNDGQIPPAALFPFSLVSRCTSESCHLEGMWCSAEVDPALRADGKTVVITGCNTGIGREVAESLYKRGARIVICTRSALMGEVAKRDIRLETTGGEMEVVHLNLGSIASIRHSASIIVEKFPRIDILINNAATLVGFRKETQDGFEQHLGVNHLGHFLFTNLILENIKAAAPSRIINLTDSSHQRTSIDFDDFMFYKNFAPYTAYNRSKLANVMFTRELAKRLEGTGVTTYALHPGHVNTRMTRHMPGWQGRVLKPIVHFAYIKPIVACRNVVHCALDPSLAHQTGVYVERQTICQTKAAQVHNDDELIHLWNISAAHVGLRM